MLAELKKTIGDMIKTQQVFYVIKDIQPASRLQVNEEKLDKLLEFLKKQKLHCEVSDFKIQKKSPYGYACSRIKRISKEKGDVYIYISKSADLAKQARNLDWSENHEELGLLQGYPECCINTFHEMHDQCHSVDFPFINLIINNSKGSHFSYLMNIMKKHRETTLLIHMPCSFDCERSMRLSRHYLNVINEDSPEYGKFLTDSLKSSVIFNNNSGIIIFDNYQFKDGKNKYKEFDSMFTTRLSKLLDESKHFEVISRGVIQLSGEKFNDHHFLEFV